jgi:PAS domain S-box-containing protein
MPEPSVPEPLSDDAMRARIRAAYRTIARESEPATVIGRVAESLVGGGGVEGCRIEWAASAHATVLRVLSGNREGRPLCFDLGRAGSIGRAEIFVEAASDEIVSALGELVDDLAAALARAVWDRDESERRYRLLAENVSDVIWVWDLDEQRLRYLSPSVERLRGFRVREALGQSLEECFTAATCEHLRAVTPARRAAAARGESATFVERLEQRCKDGSTVWTEATLRHVLDASTGHVFIYGASRDITPRLEAERRMEHVTALYRARGATGEVIARAKDERELLQGLCEVAVRLPGCAFAWVGIADAERTRLERRASASAGLDLDVAEISVARDTFATRAFRSGAPSVENDVRTGVTGAPLYNRAVEQGMRAAIALPIRRRNEIVGILAMSSLLVAYFDDAMVQLLEGMAQDLSYALDATYADEALRRSEEQYRGLLASIEDVVFSVDERGTLQFVNQAVTRFGYATDSTVGKHFGEYVLPEDAATALDHFAILESGRATVFELRLLDADRKVRFVRISARPLLDGGRFGGAHGVMTDLTRQHEIEEQLRQSQKMEAVGRLAGGVAHDFNNILGAISAYTEFAIEAVHEADPIHADLVEIRAAGRRAEALTRQLLAFSRKQVLQPVALDLNALVGNIERMLARMIGEDVELVFVPGKDVGAIRADPGQIEQVLMNLAVNARDAMPDGGTLTLRTEEVVLDDEHCAHHLDATPGRYVAVSVSDTGVGMDAATMARIFEPFFTTKAAGEGTGLGLPMVYGIVAQSGGSMTVETTIGQGTTFRIFLPRSEATVAAKASPSAAARTASRRETVLVVEDEHGLRKLVRRILDAAGYQVITAANADEALLASERLTAPLDLLITDVVMPGANGRELADRMLASRPTLKVLYMSGYTDDVVVRRGVQTTERAFLHKPFTGAVLTARVRDVLDAR